MVGIEPAMVGVTAVCRTAGDDFGVGQDRIHRFFLAVSENTVIEGN